MRLLMPLAAALLLFAGQPAWSQEAEAAPDNVFDRGCGDDQANDRCDPEVQRNMRALYGLADAETLAEQGVTLRRAMFVNGYGGDFLAVTFSRAPGRSPMVQVSTPHREGDDPQVLSAVVSALTWNRVLNASEDYDVPRVSELPRSPGGLPSFCLHEWFVVVEAVDAARLSQNVIAQNIDPSRIRRDAEGACSGGGAVPYAISLTELALDNLPECSSLDREDGRDDAGTLALCHSLRGDRIAAADALDFTQQLRTTTMEGLPDEYDLRLFYFAESAPDLAWPFKAALDKAMFELGPPQASDIDHATVVGRVYFPSGEGRFSEVADIRLELVRQTRRFVIQTYQLSERRPSR